MNFSKSCLLFVLCASFALIDGAKYMETKAAFMKTCKSKDPNFVACNTEANQLLYRQLSKGIEGLEDLQFDPIKLKKMQIVSDDGPVSINTTITKGVVTGFSSTIVVNAEDIISNQSWITKLYMPKIRIEGLYHMQGRILVLPLVGSGKCWFEPSGMDITAYTKYKLYEKFGHIFYNITDIKIAFELTGLKLRFYNLFDGAKVLEDSTNQFLNENWLQVSESFKPIISASIEDNFLLTMKKLFDYIPADYFVSDIKLYSAS